MLKKRAFVVPLLFVKLAATCLVYCWHCRLLLDLRINSSQFSSQVCWMLISLSFMQCRTTKQWTCLGWTTCSRMAGVAAIARDTCTLTTARRSSCPRFKSERLIPSLFSHVRLMFLSYVLSQAYYTEFNPYQPLSSPKVSHHLVQCGRITKIRKWCRAGQLIDFKMKFVFSSVQMIINKITKLNNWFTLAFCCTVGR